MLFRLGLVHEERNFIRFDPGRFSKSPAKLHYKALSTTKKKKTQNTIYRAHTKYYVLNIRHIYT